jgi:hypothetical protein
MGGKKPQVIVPSGLRPRPLRHGGRGFQSHLLRPTAALSALVKPGAASSVTGLVARMLTVARKEGREPTTGRATVAAADSCMAGIAWL